MSKYTIELRKLFEENIYSPALYTREEIENWFSDYKLEDYLTPEQINSIEVSGIWTKEKLAKKIVDHYYMREIGFETPELFCHYVKSTMNEIMEEYLLKIYTKFLEYDPLSSVDYTEEYTREIESNAENEGSSNSNSSSKFILSP